MTQKGKKLSYRELLEFLNNDHGMYIYHSLMFWQEITMTLIRLHGCDQVTSSVTETQLL